MGGYFVVNGLEKLIRLLIVNRRNYVLGITRPSFTKRGPFTRILEPRSDVFAPISLPKPSLSTTSLTVTAP